MCGAAFFRTGGSLDGGFAFWGISPRKAGAAFAGHVLPSFIPGGGAFLGAGDASAAATGCATGGAET